MNIFLSGPTHKVKKLARTVPHSPNLSNGGNCQTYDPGLLPHKVVQNETFLVNPHTMTDAWMPAPADAVRHLQGLCRKKRFSHYEIKSARKPPIAAQKGTFLTPRMPEICHTMQNTRFSSG